MDDHFGKLSEESDLMYKRCGPTALPQQNFSMHVAVPVSNPNAMYQAGGNQGSQALAAATASLSESGMLSPPQTSVHRNAGSGGGSQRPTSTGGAGNGFVNSRGSPGLLSTASGNGLGKVMPAKSPPPPGGNMGMGSRKPDLRVVIPPSSKGMMPPLEGSEAEQHPIFGCKVHRARDHFFSANNPAKIFQSKRAPYGPWRSAPPEDSEDRCLCDRDEESPPGPAN